MEKLKSVASPSNRNIRKAIYLSIAIFLLLSVAVFVGIFFYTNAIHIANSFIDLFNLLGASLSHIEIESLPGGIVSPPTSVPPVKEDSLFGIRFMAFLNVLISGSNWINFLFNVLNMLMILTRVTMIGVVVYLIFKIIADIYLQFKEREGLVDTHDERVAVPRESTPYRIFICLYKALHIELITKEIKLFFNYLKNAKFFKITLLIIMGFAFNIIPILLSLFVAYVNLFMFDFNALIMIFPRLFRYLYAPLVLGWWLVIIFLIYWLNSKRNKKAIKKLEAREFENEQVVRSFGMMNLFVGPPGDFKTALVTDMNMTFAKIIRFDTLDIINKFSTMFPNFNWELAERLLIQKIARMEIKTRAHIVNWIEVLEYQYNFPRRKVLLNKNNQPIRNDDRTFVFRKINKSKKTSFIFGYSDKERHVFYDGLRIVTIWVALKNYLQAYFVYSRPVPLSISNYPIDHELAFDDSSHFIKYDFSYFTRTSEDIMHRRTRSFSLNADYDDFRLGKKFNPSKISLVDCCAIAFTEFDKERGNKDDLLQFSRSDAFVNQLTDMLQELLKILRHLGMLDFNPLIKVFCDMQASSDIQARIRHLFDTIITIEKDKDFVSAYPYNWFIHPLRKKLLQSINKFKDAFRDNRRDKTLIHSVLNRYSSYLMKKIMYRENTFNTRTFTLHISHGSDDKDQIKKSVKYYVQPKKIFSDRYPTDLYKPVFDEKLQESNTNLYEQKQFQNLYPSVKELLAQNGYWPNKLVNGVIRQLEKDMKETKEILQLNQPTQNLIPEDVL